MKAVKPGFIGDHSKAGHGSNTLDKTFVLDKFMMDSHEQKSLVEPRSYCNIIPILDVP